MLHTTQWRPDTCECIISYEWDDAVPDEERVHTHKELKKACAAHAHIIDGSMIYDSVKEENQRKNQAVNAIANAHHALGKPNKNDDGDVVDYSPNENLIKWSFDSDRRLKIELKGDKINGQQKAALLTSLRALRFDVKDSKGIRVDKIDIVQ